MSSKFPLLVQALNGQISFEKQDEAQWSLLIRQARQSMLIAHVFYRMENQGLLASIPSPVLKHLHSAKIHADKQLDDLFWEIKHIKKVAERLDFSFILLKGSAYAITNHLISKGRIFSDIDILVSKENILEAEKKLMQKGWIQTKQDEYDQRFYRQWMHEIPPLIHIFRRSVIDLHHNILPSTTKACPDVNKLIANAEVLSFEDKIKVLSLEDRFIHSATHLFFDGELEHGLRDLVDLDALFSNAQNQQNFEDQLIVRALELGLQRPVFYALRYTNLILNTAITKQGMLKSDVGSPNKLLLKLMDFLFFRSLMPYHESCNDCWTGLARWLLYVRSHWLRMPFFLLIPHLLRKSWMRFAANENN